MTSANDVTSSAPQNTTDKEPKAVDVLVVIMFVGVVLYFAGIVISRMWISVSHFFLS